MSCPYCLAFTPPATPAQAAQGGTGAPKALQQRRAEQNRTLVKAYWEFEEGQSHWLGFSPKVSVLLEAAYQNWLQNPSEVRSKINATGFLYNVDYTTLLQEGQRQSQRIRRVGVTADESLHANGNGANGSAKGFCTVDPGLWREMQRQLQDLKEEQDWLLQLLRGQSASTEHADTLELKAKGSYSPLAEEVAKLWRRVGDAEAKLQSAAEAAKEAEALVERLYASVLPGRVLARSGAVGVARAVENEEVLVFSGGDEAVPEFVRSRDVQASRMGLLARPGAKVWYPDGGVVKAGVVCGPSLDPKLDARGPNGDAAVSAQLRALHAVDVLRADGQCYPVPLATLQHRACGEPQGLSVGDLVRAQLEGTDPPLKSLGTVLQVEDSSGMASDMHVRFPDEAGGFQDVPFAASKRSDLELDKESDCVRPGAAVRLRVPSNGLQSATGVVFALHGNATAVVDFLGSWGHRCAASDLEVVEDPPRIEVEIIKTLSECLTWTELLAGENGHQYARS